jgi:hypothetical protein
MATALDLIWGFNEKAGSDYELVYLRFICCAFTTWMRCCARDGYEIGNQLVETKYAHCVGYCHVLDRIYGHRF